MEAGSLGSNQHGSRIPMLHPIWKPDPWAPSNMEAGSLGSIQYRSRIPGLHPIWKPDPWAPSNMEAGSLGYIQYRSRIIHYKGDLDQSKLCLSLGLTFMRTQRFDLAGTTSLSLSCLFFLPSWIFLGVDLLLVYASSSLPSWGRRGFDRQQTGFPSRSRCRNLLTPVQCALLIINLYTI